MPTQMEGRTASVRLTVGDISVEPGQRTMFLLRATATSATRVARQFPHRPEECRVLASATISTGVLALRRPDRRQDRARGNG